MFIVFGLLFFLLLKNQILAWFLLGMYLLLFHKNKWLKESLSLIIICLILSISHNYSPNKEMYQGRVDKIHNYGFTLKGWAYRIYVSGQYEVSLGDQVTVKGQIIKEDKPSFNRHIGKIEHGQILERKESWNIRKVIYEKHPEHFEFLFDASNDHLINSFGLQLIGLNALYSLLLQRFFGTVKFQRIFLLALSSLFGRTFVWWRLILKSFNLSINQQIIILLIIFPNAIRSPSFIYAFSLYLMGKFSDKFQALESSLLFSQLSLYFFNDWHAFMLLFYPIMKYLAGMYASLIVLACFIPPLNYFLAITQSLGQFFVSTKLYQIFQIRGSLPFASFFLLIFVKSKSDHIIFFLCMLLLVVYPPFGRITYIDVGQGDSTLISLPFNITHYLIDTGRSYAYQDVKQVLKKHGVKKLDYLILTHDDADHVENKEILCKEFSPHFLIDDKSQDIEFMLHHLADYSFDDGNEDSIILSFHLHGLNYLFLGDAHKHQEALMLKEFPRLKVDILKLGHHGSDTSTSNELLKVSEAKIAMISSKPSVYNHPRPEVMRRLFNHEILPIQTSEEGHITLYSSPLFQYIKTSKGSFAIIDKGD